MSEQAFEAHKFLNACQTAESENSSKIFHNETVQELREPTKFPSKLPENSSKLLLPSIELNSDASKIGVGNGDLLSGNELKSHASDVGYNPSVLSRMCDGAAGGYGPGAGLNTMGLPSIFEGYNQADSPMRFPGGASSETDPSFQINPCAGEFGDGASKLQSAFSGIGEQSNQVLSQSEINSILESVKGGGGGCAQGGEGGGSYGDLASQLEAILHGGAQGGGGGSLQGGEGGGSYGDLASQLEAILHGGAQGGGGGSLQGGEGGGSYGDLASPTESILHGGGNAGIDSSLQNTEIGGVCGDGNPQSIFHTNNDQFNWHPQHIDIGDMHNIHLPSETGANSLGIPSRYQDGNYAENLITGQDQIHRVPGGETGSAGYAPELGQGGGYGPELGQSGACSPEYGQGGSFAPEQGHGGGGHPAGHTHGAGGHASAAKHGHPHAHRAHHKPVVHHAVAVESNDRWLLD